MVLDAERLSDEGLTVPMAKTDRMVAPAVQVRRVSRAQMARMVKMRLLRKSYWETICQQGLL